MSKTSRRERFLIALWALTAVLGFVAHKHRCVDRVFAADGDTSPKTGAVDSSYDPDRQTAAYRTGLGVSGVDTLTKTAILALPRFRVGNRTTITVGARFSDSSQTCQVQLVYIYKTGDPNTGDTDATRNTIKGWSRVITLTGSSTLKEGTYYEAPDEFFDSGRAVTIRVLLRAAPAAGTVDFWVGS